MAGRKSPSAPEWQVILERIESQNRLTIEAVETNRALLEDRIEAVATDLGGRLTNVETAVASLVVHAGGVDRRLDGIDRRLDGIDVRLDGIDVRLDRLEAGQSRLETRMDGLDARIEARERVIDRRLDLLTAALERIEAESKARDASLETGLRELRVAVLQIGAEVHELRVKVEQNSADIRDLSTRMAVLSRLEERVAALEKRTA
jgi:chromosome segregation ATPase